MEGPFPLWDLMGLQVEGRGQGRPETGSVLFAWSLGALACGDSLPGPGPCSGDLMGDGEPGLVSWWG